MVILERISLLQNIKTFMFHVSNWLEFIQYFYKFWLIMIHLQQQCD